MPFAEPEEAGGLRLNPKDIINHLLMVWACDYIPHSPTQFTQPDKPSDVIVVDVVDLDQTGEDGRPGLLGQRCWWRQAKLIQSLKPRIGEKDPVLARMGKGTGTMGRAAPYQLFSATADGPSVQRANAWLTANPGFVPGQAPPAAPFQQSTAWTPSGNHAPSHWDEPEASYMGRSPGLPPSTPPVTQAQESALERMARLAQQQQRNHHGNPQEDQPPY